MNGILITGGSGFIGTNLVQYYLDRGETVLNLDIRPPRNPAHASYWKPVDILDKNLLREALRSFCPKYLVHLAARTDLDEKKNLKGYEANIEGVSNLVLAVRAYGSIERCIYTSSQLVCQIGYIPSAETDYAPNTLYGQSKVLTEKIIRENEGGGAAWSIIRPTTVWGPWCNPHYQRFLSLIERGLYFHAGSRDLHKSFGYVGNLCYQIDSLMHADTELVNHQTFYVADYETTSLREWAEALGRELKAPRIRTFPLFVAKTAAYIGDVAGMAGFGNFPFNSFRLKNILTEYIFDLRKLWNIVPHLPYTLTDGVRNTVEWYRTKPN